MSDEKKKNSFSTILLVIALLVGLCLLLYPSVSDCWNSITQSKAVAQYAEALTEIDEEKYTEIWESAIAYNKELAKLPTGLALPDAMEERYYKELAIDDSGMIGSVEIPAIQVSLPIYHGTADNVLQVAIGHIDWTSLPTGGEGNHCVISGHRGLPSAKLFTHLDQLREGDIFMLYVLDTVFTYEVDLISIIEPHQVEALQQVEGMDLCTLMTCTPYGINSHRLLVRGHRIENLEEAKTVRILADAVQIDPMLVAPIAALPMLLFLLILLLLPKRKHQNGGESDET